LARPLVVECPLATGWRDVEVDGVIREPFERVGGSLPDELRVRSLRGNPATSQVVIG